MVWILHCNLNDNVYTCYHCLPLGVIKRYKVVTIQTLKKVAVF